MKKATLLISVMLGGMMLLGCAAHTDKVKMPKEPVRTELVAPIPKEKPTEGSLWSSDSEMASVYSDIRARRVGDIVTISIVESSSATGSATTETGRDSSVNAGVTAFLGFEQELMQKFEDFSSAKMIDANLSNEFKGSGKTVRSGSLTASITARIVDVLPNGNFVLEGRRDIIVNHERQYIVISGIVRPQDISRDNVVLSTVIADARIAYSGRGVVDDNQYPGWFTRLLNKAWPF